jgi:hypothetical protein
MPPSRRRPPNRRSKPKEVLAERKPTPEESLKTPSAPTNLRLLARSPRLISAPARWLRNNPGRVARGLWSGIFRIAALVSVGYLVFDRLYETSVTISAPVPNAIKAFAFPFAMTNDSHLFSIRNLAWQCVAAFLKTETDEPAKDVGLDSGSTAKINPGETVNVNCNKPHSPTGNFEIIKGGGQLIGGKMVIRVRYDVTIFGVYTCTRTPAPTEFNLFTDGAPPRWIKGKYAE